MSKMVDNGRFRDENGAACHEWKGYDCFSGAKLGLSTQGSLDVIFNCKESCDITARQEITRANTAAGVGCADDPSWTDSNGDHCGAWQGFNCLTASSVWGIRQEVARALLERCRKSCKLCETLDRMQLW